MTILYANISKSNPTMMNIYMQKFRNLISKTKFY